MIIETIKLKNFRNYQELTLEPHPGINILFGQNGVGKTNLLEAIHYCALGRSHRTSLDRETVMAGCLTGAIGVNMLRSGERHEIAIRLMPEENKKKQVFIDRKKAGRLSELMGKLQVVIFSPEDLQLIKEGPSIRRRFLDMMLSQLYPSYFTALQQYQKALDQRNSLLRQARKENRPLDQGMMAAFEQAMAAPCCQVIQHRQQVLHQLSLIAREKYRDISGREKEEFLLTYEACLEEASVSEEACLEKWKNDRQHDLFRGSTSFGIHREDIGLYLMDRDMKLFASQGQIRTAALSMKLAQLELFRQKNGESPVLLLDDVMSELDMTRRTSLLKEIEGVQTFITCTDESDLEGCREKRSYAVIPGENGFAGIMEKSTGEAFERKIEVEEPDFS